ncbi:MAG: hypothetical protein AB7T63_10370 [Planctomycetota bacterium]
MASQAGWRRLPSWARDLPRRAARLTFTRAAPQLPLAAWRARFGATLAFTQEPGAWNSALDVAVAQVPDGWPLLAEREQLFVLRALVDALLRAHAREHARTEVLRIARK